MEAGGERKMQRQRREIQPEIETYRDNLSGVGQIVAKMTTSFYKNSAEIPILFPIYTKLFAVIPLTVSPDRITFISLYPA